MDTPGNGDTAEPPQVPSESSVSRRSNALALALLVGMFAVGALIEADPNSARLFGVEGPMCPSRLVLPVQGQPPPA